MHLADGPELAGVYPRVGGGTCPSVSAARPLLGLSPRGRGNLTGAANSGKSTRSIPAWAGEPPVPGNHYPAGRVYPRVGGGTPFLLKIAHFGQGLSPRGRGNPGQ